jgi:deoxyadenosine/deoxycytidine kinase
LLKYKFITIEGNIGAGKTTLARVLSKRLNSRLILEEFAENPFLAKFYENPEKQLKLLLSTSNLFQTVTVSDYMFVKSLLFAKINLPQEEFKLYQKLFDIMYQQLVQADILIYLHAPVNKLQQNIRKRNREYEQSIPNDYLQKIHDAYINYIKQHNLKTLIVDAANADFENNEQHIAKVLSALEKDYVVGQHYLALP